MTDLQRGAGRFEHLLVDRLVPILLIVLIPVGTAMWMLNEQQHDARRDQLLQSCERGNDIRRDQRVVFDALGQAAAVLSVGAGDESVRDYFAQATDDIGARRDNIKIVNCAREIP